MNKKLFALLTSAALMAGAVPAVFADAANATLTIKPQADTVVAGKDAKFDIVVDANVQLNTVQFAFTVENGEIADDGFVFNEDNIKKLGAEDKSWKGKMTDEEKAKFVDNEDYMVMAYDIDFAKADAPKDLVIGTLTVKAGDKDTVKVSTSTAKNEQGGVANYEVDLFANWKTVDGSVKVTSEEESKADSKPESKPDSKTESKTDSKTESKTDSASSSESKTDSSSSKAAATTSSKAATNNTTANTNTGAASTAAVALAASAAALVVISKKRK